jgi:hypothetical protein
MYGGGRRLRQARSQEERARDVLLVHDSTVTDAYTF